MANNLKNLPDSPESISHSRQKHEFRAVKTLILKLAPICESLPHDTFAAILDVAALAYRARLYPLARPGLGMRRGGCG